MVVRTFHRIESNDVSLYKLIYIVRPVSRNGDYIILIRFVCMFLS